jgi:hypothetical protein
MENSDNNTIVINEAQKEINIRNSFLFIFPSVFKSTFKEEIILHFYEEHVNKADRWQIAVASPYHN